MRRLLISIVFLLTLSACGSDFPAACDEEHQAVNFARSLAADRLMFLHDEMFRLRDEAGDPNFEFELARDNTPENLAFLGAVKIRPNHLYYPNIMLADCFSSFVYLNFYKSELYGNRVELAWMDSSRGSKKQILWQATNGIEAGDME